MGSRVINISIPEELLREVENAAKRERRSRSEFFREAARRYMEGKRRDSRTTMENSWDSADRRAFAASSAASFNRIWDNPVDAEVWDNWEEKHAAREKASTR